MVYIKSEGFEKRREGVAKATDNLKTRLDALKIILNEDPLSVDPLDRAVIFNQYLVSEMDRLEEEIKELASTGYKDPSSKEVAIREQNENLARYWTLKVVKQEFIKYFPEAFEEEHCRQNNHPFDHKEFKPNKD